MLAAAMLAVLLAAAGIVWKSRPVAAPPARLAILPLEAQDTDASTKTLVEGATYDLSNRLTRLHPRPPQLVVIPVDRTKGWRVTDLGQAKGRLGATHVLRGIVTRTGDRLVLQGSLVDTSTKVAIRELSAEYDSTDSAALAPALVAMVAEAFSLPRQTAVESVAPAAYADYVRGVSALQSSVYGLRLAIGAFEKAIALDPKSALPRAGLADAYYQAWRATNDPEWLTRGRQHLEEAERRNPDSIAVRLAAGKLSLAPGSYDRALQEFHRAIQLDPASAQAWSGLGLAYESMEDRDNDAVAAYLRAIELQPGYFDPVIDLGEFYRLRGNYQEAARYWRRVTELAPQLLAGHVNLGALYGDIGRYEDAERELKFALEIDPRSRAV